MKKLLSTIIFVIFSIPVFPLYIFEEFYSLVSQADLIIVGEIISSKIIGNKTQYTINIKETIKGYAAENSIVTYQKNGIKTGCEYIFLLKKQEDIYVDYFEGMTKFEIEYIEYKDGFNYCISLPKDIIGVNDFTIQGKQDLSDGGKRWNAFYYPVEYVINIYEISTLHVQELLRLALTIYAIITAIYSCGLLKSSPV